MVVRQHLQLLISTDRLNKVMQQDAVVARRSIAKLALALFNASPYSACQPSFAEPLIKLYKGTRDLADHDLLSVFGLYERYRKVSLSKAIVAMWTPQLNMGADENDTSLDAVKQLDPRIVFASCIAFEKTSNDDDASKCYDTGFILSLTAACLRDGTLTGLQWVEILRSNVLAVVACALASRSAHHRNMASCILGAAIEMVEVSRDQHPRLSVLICTELTLVLYRFLRLRLSKKNQRSIDCCAYCATA
jgi:nucleolar pre-ribosomal-associated protein 1